MMATTINDDVDDPTTHHNRYTASASKVRERKYNATQRRG